MILLKGTSASDVPPSATSARQQSASTISHNPMTPMPFRCFPGSKAKRVRFYRNGDQYFKVI